ncbi:hypothetical protein IFM89_020677 [Coptis chinensis]|uniref:Uncharacterized protein n=1 Tax=Coptis chinensis TaxID=261450 RepID=A0A835LEU4_9MAGN|nr:hypothetical protein IFM89_020677 [Coptis chinensis]
MDKQKEKILERKKRTTNELRLKNTSVGQQFPILCTVPSKGPENESLRKEIAVQTESTKLSDEQPFSVLLKKSRSHIKKGVVGGLIRNKAKKRKVQAKREMWTTLLEDDGPLPVQERSLPFIKSSDDLWGIIESKEIFCLLPQNPHFLPLKKYNEDLREGYAIGAMWSFAKLAEVTRKLKLKEPRSVLESKLTALMELEKLGFTVQQIQARLEKLLKIRDFIDQLDDRSKSVERKITKDQREVEHLQQSITQLKLKIQEKEKECSKLADLERKLNVTKESMQGLRLDFHRVVSTPW